MDFMVSDDGIVYNPNGSIKNQYRNGDGYKTASVKLLNGKWQTFGVHRLVALAHLTNVLDTDLLTVNHIDKNIENNEAYNLEWVSVHLNNIHASLMRKDNFMPTMILIDPLGIKSFIKNLHEVSNLLSIDIETSWWMIKNNIIYNGYQLLLLNKIPEELKKKHQPVFDSNGKIKKIELFVKNLDTGEIDKFNSITETAAKFNVKSNHITQTITYPGTIRLFKRKYLIVKNFNEIPTISSEEYEELKNPTGKETLAFNFETKQITIFESASELIRVLNLSKKAISTRLRGDGIGQINNILFAYRNKEKEFMDKVKSSSSFVQ